jgi:ADP-ribosylglycohydrolase
LETLIREGGDTLVNGSLCGAMLGAKIGYSNLPKDWIEALPGKDRIDDQVRRFLSNCMNLTL